jgi:hypothetical protein
VLAQPEASGRRSAKTCVDVGLHYAQAIHGDPPVRAWAPRRCRSVAVALCFSPRSTHSGPEYPRVPPVCLTVEWGCAGFAVCPARCRRPRRVTRILCEGPGQLPARACSLSSPPLRSLLSCLPFLPPYSLPSAWCPTFVTQYNHATSTHTRYMYATLIARALTHPLRHVCTRIRIARTNSAPCSPSSGALCR